MMMFYKKLCDFIGRSLSPNTLVDEKRKQNLRKVFGDSLVSYEPPKFSSSAPIGDVCNKYRVVLRIKTNLTIHQVFEVMRERVATCCGGGEISDKGVWLDYEKKTVSFIVKPTYHDRASLPDGARNARAA